MAKKGKKRKNRNKNRTRGDKKITFGGALAAGGEVSSVIGIVVAWIMAVCLVLGGLYFGAMGIVGKTPLFDDGTCASNAPDPCMGDSPPCGSGCFKSGDSCYRPDPCSGAAESSCKNVKTGAYGGKCVWNPPERLSGGTRAMYIGIGVAMIAFAVGIVLFAYWWNRKVHQDKNMAAFAGGVAGIQILGSAFRN